MWGIRLACWLQGICLQNVDLDLVQFAKALGVEGHWGLESGSLKV